MTMKPSDLITNITDIHHNRFEILGALEGPKLGWTSIYTPEEILYAAGITPYRISGETCPKTPRASAHMHRNICPYVLSCLEEVLGGKHDFADGAVITNVCDARRRLHDVWHYYRPDDFVHMPDLPKVIDPTTKAYFITELEYLIDRLEDRFQVTITEEKLRHAIRLYNRSRQLLQQLYDLRNEIQPSISGEDYMRIVKAAMTGPREVFNEKLSLLIDALKDQEPRRNFDPRIMICGSYFDHPHIIRVIEEMGGVVACEDISNGIKYFEGTVDEVKPPLTALADYYLDKTTCAALFDSGKRFDHMMDLVNQYRVDAVVYVSLKFCDNNLIDFHYQQKRFAEKQIPVLFLETERMASNMGQIRTRIQAFLESAML
ncbi:MAG: 2-hydroxyacyl-CoA dehydratase family protein [Desulfobacterales bacterium]|nr:2-hydroxyacyl-CoA dehydratase family protein [Desulfobacterales bacterium]